MLSAQTYRQRRESISQKLSSAPIVISAFHAMQQTNDDSAPFVQESSFFWLTGITQPGWVLIIGAEKSILVSPSKTEIQQIFNGDLSADEAIKISGVDEVILKNGYTSALREMSKNHEEVFTLFSHPNSNYFDFVANPAYQKTKRHLHTIFNEVSDCRKELAKLKAIKSADEIALIQKAVDISIDGFAKLRNDIARMSHEYQIEALLSYEFRHVGAQGHAYHPIVGNAKNACTLHYNMNNDKLVADSMVLIDAGARVGGYAADITRTYAIGSPSKRHIDVHAAVEKAHQKIIGLIRPGYGFKDYQLASDEIMEQALKSLGLLNKPADYRKYFPHAVSHGLGIDVHDSLGGYETFRPGMVITVEPGIYIPEESIGVRIEDDILVTDTGHRNLSAALPTSL